MRVMGLVWGFGVSGPVRGLEAWKFRALASTGFRASWGFRGCTLCGFGSK